MVTDTSQTLIEDFGIMTKVARVSGGKLLKFDWQIKASYAQADDIVVAKVSEPAAHLGGYFVDINEARRAVLKTPNTLHQGQVLLAKVTRAADYCPAATSEIALQSAPQSTPKCTPQSSKGALLSTDVTVSTPTLVLLWQPFDIIVAKQIRDRPEVVALRDELANWCQQDQFACALILRSAAVDADTSTIRGDYDALRQTAKTLEARLQQRSAGLAYTSPSLVVQAVDKASVTDCELEHTPIVWPAVLSRDSASTSTIKLDTGIVPLFERCGVQRAIDELLQSRVALRHGGELVIEQTEAMITIDVNSRADQRPPREVNLEAVAKCAEQILLRNLGGLIVVDLIDMIERKDRTAVERAIARALSTDDLQHEIAPITSFGLLQIKRQRGGFNAGRTVPASTILLDQLMRELFSLTQASAVRAYTILVAEPLAFALLNTFAPNLARIQDLLDLKLTVCAKKHWSNSSYTIKPSPT